MDDKVVLEAESFVLKREHGLTVLMLELVSLVMVTFRVIELYSSKENDLFLRKISLSNYGLI